MQGRSVASVAQLGQSCSKPYVAVAIITLEVLTTRLMARSDRPEVLGEGSAMQDDALEMIEERIIIDDYEFDIMNVSDTRIETVKMKKLK